MPVTVYDDVYEGGVRTSRTARVISDAELLKRDAPARLRQSYSALTQWASDARAAATAEQAASDGWALATAGQKDTANKALHTRMAVTFDRLATFFDRFADVLIQQELDQ